jgi:addiction module HigA family antidote
MVILREEIENGLVDVADDGDELLPPPHPGEHIRDWLEQTGVTAYARAKAMEVPQTRIAEIPAGRLGIAVDMAVRLGRAIGTSAEMWIGLQTGYELELARRNRVGEDVERIAS